MGLESLRTTLALAAIRDLGVIQFDITSAYLHGTLKEKVYMEQPEGYVAPGKEYWVWGLKKGLYGLVQAGRTWNEGLNAYIESDGFTGTPKDPAICVKNSWTDRDFAPAGFWVYDCVATARGRSPMLLGRVSTQSSASPVWEKSGMYSGMLLERSFLPSAESVSHLPFTILWSYCLHKYLERSP